MLSPILPLAIAEIPEPFKFGVAKLSSDLFKIEYGLAPLSLSSARRITRPSEWILFTCISLSIDARLTKAPSPVLSIVIVPSIFVLIDFVKSLSAGPTPVQTPPSQGPTSSPTEPSVTVVTKSAPLVVLIRILSTP